MTFEELKEIYKEEEIWKPINQLEGYYEISNYGRVKALHRKIIAKNGRLFEFPERLMPLGVTKKGYLAVQFSKNSRKISKLVHRLVAEAFIPNVNNKPAINHKNCQKDINFYLNLEWVTNAENMRHAVENKLYPSRNGENGGYVKLTWRKVKQIRKKILKKY